MRICANGVTCLRIRNLVRRNVPYPLNPVLWLRRELPSSHGHEYSRTRIPPLITYLPLPPASSTPAAAAPVLLPDFVIRSVSSFTQSRPISATSPAREFVKSFAAASAPPSNSGPDRMTFVVAIR